MKNSEILLVTNYLGIRVTNSWTKSFEPILNPTKDWQYRVNNLIHENIEDESWFITTLKFDESWDWLMLLLNKVIIDGIENTHKNLFEEIQFGLKGIDIMRVYKACLKFIEIII